MWFKKKAYISDYNSNTAADGRDWRTKSKNQSWSASQTLPSAADANNYFYLPALGYYHFGQLSNVGGIGFYWSSSANPSARDDAYTLYFDSGAVKVDSYRRSRGNWVGGFE